MFIVVPYANSATYYFDHDAVSNGVGTLADPYNTFSGVTFAPPNKYLLKRGTVINEQLRIPATHGTSYDYCIFVGAYGSAAARPKLDGENNTAIQSNPYIGLLDILSDYAIVTDIDVYRSAGVGVRVAASYVKFSNSEISYADIAAVERPWTMGIMIIGSGNLTVTGFRGRNIYSHHNGHHGISHVYRVNNSRIYKSKFSYNGQRRGSHGANHNQLYSSFSADWVQVGATDVWYHEYLTTHVAQDGQAGLNRTPTRCFVISEDMLDLTYDAGDYASLDSQEWDIYDGNLYINIGKTPNGETTRLVTDACTDIGYEDCEFNNQRNVEAEEDFPDTPVAYHEGMGLGFDDYVSYSYAKRCYMHDNTGMGVTNNGGIGNSVSYSLIENNDNSGIAIMQHSRDFQSINNTIRGNGEGYQQTGEGMPYQYPSGIYSYHYVDGTTTRNNICENNTDDGIDETEGNITNSDHDYNCVYGNDTDTHRGDHSIESNPEFNTGLSTLSSNSPCIGTGVVVTAIHEATDYGGDIAKIKIIGERIDMGCYQYPTQTTLYTSVGEKAAIDVGENNRMLVTLTVESGYTAYIAGKKKSGDTFSPWVEYTTPVTKDWRYVKVNLEAD